jgi:ABC-type branched-chain amino acid transport systems, periplasmic component|nr:ABC transporter substrate-binding protein [Methanoculleus marisnigri]
MGEAVQGIFVGALLPLTGDYAEGGEASRVALEVAAGDINDYFTAIDSDYRVGVIVEDTGTDPAVALEKLQALGEQGVRIVIGPGSSAELNATRTYADEHGIVLISTMSTAPSLAIADDNVYRFVPPDTYQADAMAYYLKEEGTSAIVPAWRGDVWGDELEKLATASFKRGNGTVLDGVRYAPGDRYARKGKGRRLPDQPRRGSGDHGGCCEDPEPHEGPVVRVRRQRPPRFPRDRRCRPVCGADEIYRPGVRAAGPRCVGCGYHPEDPGYSRTAA